MAVPEPGAMEEQNRENYLQFLQMASNWTDNASGLYGDLGVNQHYMIPGYSGVHPEPVQVPQWMYPHQTPQNYVEFLAERGYPEFQKQMSYESSKQVTSLGLADPSQLEEYVSMHNEGNSVNAFRGSEHQLSIEKQNWNEECSHAPQVHSGSRASSSKHTSEACRKRSKEKAYAADRCRRMRIAHWLDALHDVTPHPKQVGKVDLLDDVIDHIKHLQHQLQDLCRSRLGGESFPNPFIFFEGHGHYIVQDKMLNGPLEDLMGKLIDVYPSAATELLKSRGLVMMPMTNAEGLVEPTEMFGTQGYERLM